MTDDRQRFHANRSSTMRIGMRGLLFTVNPKQEQKAQRELTALLDRVLADMPAELFACAAAAAATSAAATATTTRPISADDANQFDDDDDAGVSCSGDDASDADGNADKPSSPSSAPPPPAPPTSGGTFADELRAELEGMRRTNNSNSNGVSSSAGGAPNKTQGDAAADRARRAAKNAQRRCRAIETNCKGFMFFSINLASHLLCDPNQQHPQNNNIADASTTETTDPAQARGAQVLAHLLSPASTIVMDIAAKLIATVSNSDVPLIRFSFYAYPILGTIAPSVTSACALADVCRHFIQVPAGKSAAKIECHFLVRNNSGVAGVALEELKRNFYERLPMNRFFVLNQSGVAVRRQRGEGATAAPARVVNASVSFIVLHSVAMIALQPNFSAFCEYGLHKMGASFADALTG